MQQYTGTEILQASNEGATEARLSALEKNNKELTLRLVALETIERERQGRAETEKNNIQANPSHGLTQEVIDELSGEFSVHEIKRMFCKLEAYYERKGFQVPYGQILVKKLRQWFERDAEYRQNK